MSTPVLATKLFPPSPRAGLVARPRLADLLNSTLNPGHRLTLISAPAGFGKTTLISDWASHRSNHLVRHGWLSLDDADNDPPRFLTHLAAALSSTGLELDVQRMADPGAAPIVATLTTIVNELVRAEAERPNEHWLLLLDDYHVIEAPEVHEAVIFLLDHVPNRLHLLISTRSDPPLPLSRLRSRAQLTEVRAADLRFAPTEAREFLTEVMGLALTDIDVQAIEERTEGWIAGLQLAALSLRGISDRGQVTEFIGAFTGTNRFVLDYLVDEVLTRLDGEVRDFLLRTAVLDRLTGSLCDAVTGGTDAARVLEELDRGNMFVVALDADRSWYRYHHLFGDVLHARLLNERPEQVPALHRAASDWYASHNLLTDAVRHALAAADVDRAGYLMETALPDVRRARQDRLLLDWMRSLPDSVVRRSPVLGITSAWSHLMAGELDPMERRLDDADAALAAGAQDETLAATWADTEDLRTAPATVWVYRAALAQARGDVPGTVRSARHALDLAGPEDHFVRGAAAGFLGLAAWAAGDVEEALSTFAEAVRSLHAAGNLVDELDSTVVLGDMWITAGRPRRARRLYDHALATATAHGEPYPRATADLHVALAELDRELNDLAGADAHLETARVLRERGSITENRHRWFVAMACLRAAAGDYASTEQLLDRAAELYRPGFYPDLRPIPAVRARLQLAAGDLAAAEEWTDDPHVPAAGESNFLCEYENLTLVRVLLARFRASAETRGGTADPSPLTEALVLLDRLQADAESTRGGSLLEIGILRALTHEAGGDRLGALVELDRALAGAPEPDGYVRLFLDEGAPMLALLHDAVRSGSAEGTDVLRRHARRLLDADSRAHRPAPAAPTGGSPIDRGSLPEALSERELEVLRLLQSELTGPEIARQLFVSLNTLRTHTKRIFTKLDVTNRSAAVRRGRELGLL